MVSIALPGSYLGLGWPLSPVRKTLSVEMQALYTGVVGAAPNVEINLSAIKDEGYKIRVRSVERIADWHQRKNGSGHRRFPGRRLTPIDITIWSTNGFVP